MTKIGRNDPCPCGSGKKYKHCCLGSETDSQGENLSQDFVEDLKALSGEQAFESLEELDSFAALISEKKNTVSQMDFLGFSADQMHRMMYDPIESLEDILKFNHRLDSDVYLTVPIAKNAWYFISRLQELQPLKATRKGNLPLAFTRELFEKFRDSELTIVSHVRSEEDARTVHVLRLMLDMCGWLKKVKNQYSLTKKGSNIVEKGFSGQHFFVLLNAFTRRFNWGFQDQYPDFQVIQWSLAYSLYLLRQKAKEDVPEEVLGDAFIRAFPAVLAEVAPDHWEEPKVEVQRCFSLRFLERFCEYFGLVDIQREKVTPYQIRRIIRKSAFYDQYIKWVK